MQIIFYSSLALKHFEILRLKPEIIFYNSNRRNINSQPDWDKFLKITGDKYFQTRANILFTSVSSKKKTSNEVYFKLQPTLLKFLKTTRDKVNKCILFANREGFFMGDTYLTIDKELFSQSSAASFALFMSVFAGLIISEWRHLSAPSFLDPDGPDAGPGQPRPHVRPGPGDAGAGAQAAVR